MHHLREILPKKVIGCTTNSIAVSGDESYQTQGQTILVRKNPGFDGNSSGRGFASKFIAVTPKAKTAGKGNRAVTSLKLIHKDPQKFELVNLQSSSSMQLDLINFQQHLSIYRMTVVDENESKIATLWLPRYHSRYIQKPNT
ncbi:hypothetical protein NPIL_223341 [Nephila pilipes]|uniref:Uncharacterized protein n=1 Tax=Nephila pilipes TaxID=299642 RepID=A0A8X6JBN9_NEPPI|nr:hypothetical protein NPIL_223341 [Nephila pilipes]